MDSLISDTNGLTITKDLKLRPMKCEAYTLSNSDSSVTYSQGMTCVVAACSGPMECKLQHMNGENAYVECIYRPKAGVATIHHKLFEGIIKDTVIATFYTNKLCRAKFSVQVQEVEDRSGLFACALNAVSLAMLMNGASMRYVFTAVHCILDAKQRLILDPDLTESKNKLATFTFAFENVQRKVVTVYANGSYTRAQFNDAELLCRAASFEVLDYFRAFITPLYNVIRKNVGVVALDYRSSEEDDTKAENASKNEKD
ncbi:exosome complex component RRP46-like [Teleopsis dalmanni]|uniref:exosome complex component RRP46-like n=1 Tax=Teleopsis dalmanni TaxID=139649 RepID=UPI0018CF2517|nr:exosome complex component RRP46-like [Teleopsis dalmanni]